MRTVIFQETFEWEFTSGAIWVCNYGEYRLLVRSIINANGTISFQPEYSSSSSMPYMKLVCSSDLESAQERAELALRNWLTKHSSPVAIIDKEEEKK